MKPPLSNGFLRLGIAIAAALALLLPSAAQALPDGYVYEKVSPADKGNGEVAGGASLTAGIVSAAHGDRIIYYTNSPFAGATSFSQTNDVFAERGADSWSARSTTAILPYYVTFGFGGSISRPFPFPMGLSADGSKTVIETNIDPQTGLQVPTRIYLVDLPSGTTQRISPDPVAGDPYAKAERQFENSVDGTGDYSTVFFSSQAQLSADATAPGVPAADPKLYVHTAAGTSFASYLPGGAPSGGFVVSADPGQTETQPSNGISDDGNVYWWTQGTSFGAPLYRAELGVQDSVLANESENTTTSIPPGKMEFEGGAADGERAIFGSDQALTDDAPTWPGHEKRSLFLYTHSADPVNDNNLTYVSKDNEPADGENPVLVTLGVSDDAKTVYFTADGQLVSGGPTGPGEKLYRWTLSGGLEYLGVSAVKPASAPPGTVALNAFPPGVTPDGRYLAFGSAASGITPEDNGGFDQVYLYDSQDGSVVCVSCPSGAANTGPVDGQAFDNLASITGKPIRTLSDDGRLIFATAERLLPTDINGKKDVYTYKGGELDLVSSGRATRDVRFADATADGSRIYFATSARLNGWDQDNKKDLYVARIGNGLPEPNVRPTTPCSGDDCQGPSPRAPGDAVGSATYRGPGNAKPADCSTAKDPKRIERKAKKAKRRAKTAKHKARKAKRKARGARGKRGKRLERRADSRQNKAKRMKRKQRRLKRSVRRERSELRACRERGR